MIYASERAGVICEQLKTLMKTQTLPLTDWEMKEGNFLRPADADAAAAAWQPFDSRTMHWYGKDRHYWFRTSFTVPESMAGQPIRMQVQTQIDEWDDGRNPQFLLFVNGEITQGLDMHHREAMLTERAESGKTYTLDLQAYTGIMHSEFRLIGEIAVIDREVEALYYDLQVPLWAFSRIEKGEKVRLDMETALNAAVNLLDMRQVPSEAFSASVRAARAHLQTALYTDLAGCDDVIATCIGHTHIDVAWWWTVEQTREKVARSFATVLKLMEEYPDYKFMSSQPQLYVFLKARYPELYEKVKARIREGRWEPEGGMWLEADCNLTSGESLVRQFVYGKRFFKEEFGVDNRILWLPDVFGYSGALPQIMKKSGIDYFMTTKLSWNQFNKVPHDTLMWRGIDGSEVLTHFISTLGVGQPIKNFFTTYNGMLHPDALIGAWERYQDKEINNDILIAFGYGDGGGGPTRPMLETAKRMDKGVKGMPRVRQAFSRDYFEALEVCVKDNKELATWEGEFYFEYHRGTYTSMARNKRGNRKSELLLMDLELLSVLAARCGMAYPTEKLRALWEIVLLNQFHDILPGSSIKEVYDQTKIEYEQIEKEATELIATCLQTIAGKGSGVTLFNTTGFMRDDIVCLDALDGTGVADENGRIYPLQQTADGALAFVRELPEKGARTYRVLHEEMPAPSPFVIDETGIETPFYKISVSKDGAFTSIFDKENAREVLKPGTAGNALRVYEDKPIYYDSWDVDIFHTEKSWPVDDVCSMEWTEAGPVRATLEITRRYCASKLCQRIHFYADMRRIDFETWVDWHEHQQLLKVHFPVDVHTDEATFDVQFGNVTRKTHKNTSWDVARFESCGQKWADVSEYGYGVSLLNDCKYGHSVHDGDFALTLIKSGIEPYPDADNERHMFTYALYPHAGTWREANTPQMAYFLNQPVYAAAGGAETTGFSFASADNAVLETVKLAEDGDGIVLRIYENMNRRAPVTVRLDGKIASVESCNLLETPEESIEPAGDTFSFTIKPYEIRTFRVRFNSK